jgi:hypothetical protein
MFFHKKGLPMKLRYLIALLLVATASQLIYSKIHTINDITKITRHIFKNVHEDIHFKLRNGTFLNSYKLLYEKGASEVLVCFDIDETLLYPNEPEARDAWFGTHMNELIKLGKSPAEAVKETVIRQIIAHKRGYVCQADWDQDELIDALQQQGVRVIALTARSIDFVDITYRQLHQVLVDVTRVHGERNRCYILKNLPRPAYYTPGIVFCAGNDKGTTLEQFLLQIQYRPAYLVMVDDTRKHIEALDRMTKRLGIKYDGFVITHTYHKRLPCVIMADGVTAKHKGIIKSASN